MLVKLTQDLKNGFGPWKEMLLANGHKLKEHGMTCIFCLLYTSPSPRDRG